MPNQVSPRFPEFARLVGGLALAFILLAFSGCDQKQPSGATIDGAMSAPGVSGSKPKRIVFLINTDDPFWDACRQGLNEGAKQFNLASRGLTAEMEVPDGTIKGQIDKLRQLASQSDLAGLAVSAISAENSSIAEELERMQARGVKVVTVDGDVLRSKYRQVRKYYIGTDNEVAGEMLGKAASQLLQARGKTNGGYVQFAGYTDNDNARSRMDGFRRGVGTAFEEIDRMSDETDRSRALENVRNAIANHKQKLVALVGIWAYNAPAIATAVDAAGAKSDLVVVTFDAQEQAIKDMEKGRIDAMMVQNPFDMGFQSARLLSAMVLGDDAVEKEMFPNYGEEGGDIYTTGLRLVVPNGETKLKKEDFDPAIVEFMTLDEFKAWLAKFGLKSS